MYKPKIINVTFIDPYESDDSDDSDYIPSQTALLVKILAKRFAIVSKIPEPPYAYLFLNPCLLTIIF